MKILYLTHPEADQGGYCLWSGLCEKFGVNSIVEFPWKASYHGEIDRYHSFYDAPVPDSQWQQNREMTGVTGPFEWAIPRESVKYSKQEIKNMLIANKFDFILCESPRTGVCNSLEEFKNLSTAKIIMHDSEDYDAIRDDIIDKYDIRLYLKREYFKPIVDLLNRKCVVKPFPFSPAINMPYDVNAERDIDILCAVGNTNEKRKKIRGIVDKFGELGFKVDTGYYIWEEYIEKMKRTKIAIAPRGWAEDTLRRWDIPMMGALLLAERLNIVEETELIDGIHCVKYLSDGSNFEEKLQMCLDMNTKSRLNLAANGQRYVLKYNSNAARINQLFAWASQL